MATSRAWAYLGSTKNLAGSACGLAGLGLHLAGLAGPYWLFVVAGLYAAGALAAPPERVVLVLDDTAAESGRLRADLEVLVERVAGQAGRVPPGAMVRFGEIVGLVRELLARREVLSLDPDARYEIARVVRTDLPEGFETYLNLPGWFASGRTPGGRRSAAEELAAQLDLIAAQLLETAERVYETDARRLRDQTRYLQDRDGRAE
ncbi:hypothetical protein [Actinomadura craniellae]|uniref:hypothetical protein n=1 Tax=Actinomadura craniellae TaxID=2231787 RepID=UPI001314CDDB|nr:hypothetical protein [Actinomadura craniellae]